MQCTDTRCSVRFPCAIGVVFGVLLLVGGACVILIWAFVPNFSQVHPIGLQIGAIACGLGVVIVVSALIVIYRWHIQISAGRNSHVHRKHGVSKLGNARESYIDTPSVFPVGSKSSAGLKKAHSTAYITLGPNQAEKVKILSLVHGFISVTDLRRPLRNSCSFKPSTHSQSNGVFRDSVVVEPTNTSTIFFSAGPDVSRTTRCYKRFARDKSLRCSLPRVLVHPSVRPSIHESHSQSDLNETNHERLHLDVGGQNSQENVVSSSVNRPNKINSIDREEIFLRSQPQAKQSIGSRHSTREVNFSKIDQDNKPRHPLTRVLTTPPIGRASLFNLTSSEHIPSSVWMNPDNSGGGTNNPESAGSNPNKIAHDSRVSLNRTNSGKRFLLMSQNGHVISCTTLFGEELEVDASNSGGLGCRRLQACPGWNFFPVFVENDRFASDEELAKLSTSTTIGTTLKHFAHTSDAGLSCTNSDIEMRCTRTGNLDVRSQEPHDSSHALSWFRRVFKRGRSRNKRNRKHRATSGPTNADLGLRESLISTLKASEKTKSDTSSNVITDRTSDPEQPVTMRNSDLLADESAADLRTSPPPNAFNNASVFSLPAISPDLWTADRPVWIMGVPVTECETTDSWLATMDTCDVILLREKQGDGPDVVTGSSSSVYAFHVRPPARLRPISHSRSNRSHGRARSLGRILVSEKSPAMSE